MNKDEKKNFIALLIECFCSRSRKRGPSSSCDLGYGEPNDQMNECNAALVLMSLSCSPNSPRPSKCEREHSAQQLPATFHTTVPRT